MTIANEPIRIKNLGPIKFAEVPAVPGEVTVLHGRNAVGKTKALEAIQSLASGTGKLSLKDGEVSGSIEWGEVRATVRRSTRREGELEFGTLEGRFSFDDLVKPDVKDPVAADAKSIKAIVRLVGSEADPQLFYDLAGGKELFEEIVKPASLKGDDLVAMAAAVKRDFEAAARKAEADAEHQAGHAKAIAESIEGINLEAPHDKAKLDAEVANAIKGEASIRERMEHANRTREEAKSAREQLDAAKAGHTGPTVEAAEEDLERKRNRADAARQRFQEIREQLKAAEGESVRMDEAQHAAERVVEAAKSHQTAIAGWESSIAKAEGIECPSEEELLAASGHVAASQENVEQGVRVRDAIDKQRKANDHAAAAKMHEREAEKLRDAARATDDVLSEIVSRLGGKLRVEILDGKARLVTDTSRGKTFYRDLSEGERTSIGCDIAIGGLSSMEAERRLLVLGQEFWQGLDYENKQLFRERIAETDIVAITAECAQTPEEADLGAKVL